VEAAVYGWDPHDFREDGGFTVVSSFRRWVSELHDSDADNLHKVGIDLDRLREAAHAGLVHGMILTGVTPRALLALLHDPRVAAVHAYRIAFTSIP